MNKEERQKEYDRITSMRRIIGLKLDEIDDFKAAYYERWVRFYSNLISFESLIAVESEINCLYHELDSMLGNPLIKKYEDTQNYELSTVVIKIK